MGDGGRNRFLMLGWDHTWTEFSFGPDLPIHQGDCNSRQKEYYVQTHSNKKNVTLSRNVSSLVWLEHMFLRKEWWGCTGGRGDIHEINGESLKHLMHCDDIIILYFDKWYEQIWKMCCKWQAWARRWREAVAGISVQMMKVFSKSVAIVIQGTHSRDI